MGAFFLEQWKKDSRREPVITDLDALVPKDHLLRKIKKVMDYEWLYERLDPYYCHDNGRPGTDPVVLIKKPIEDKSDDDEDKPQGGGTVEKTVSTTDCGMFVKGEHERQFAYEAHTACDRKGFVVGVEVTAGNIHDSVAWDKLYEQITARLPQIEFVTMDAGSGSEFTAVIQSAARTVHSSGNAVRTKKDRRY